MKIQAKDRFLHPVELYPEDSSDTQSYALEFSAGQCYEVDESQAILFVHHGWAEVVPDDADVELAEPRNLREDPLSDKEVKALAKAQDEADAAANVQTVRYIGTGTRERVADHGGPPVHEGDNVRVIDLGLGGKTPRAKGDTLDVQDSGSGSGTNL